MEGASNQLANVSLVVFACVCFALTPVVFFVTAMGATSEADLLIVLAVSSIPILCGLGILMLRKKYAQKYPAQRP